MPNIICEELVMKNGKPDIVEREASKFWNEKIQRLEEENKNLKKLVDLNEKKEKLHKEHIKELEREATKHKNTRNYYEKHQRPELQEKIAKLEEENKKLKRANELNAELHKTSEETIGQLEKEIKKLKEERNELKKKYMKTITTAAKQKKELREQIDELGKLCENIDDNAYNTWKKITGNEDEEEEVDTCAKCNKKRECISDLFVTHDETMTGRTGDWGSGKKFMLCGQCSLNHVLAKQVK